MTARARIAVILAVACALGVTSAATADAAVLTLGRGTGAAAALDPAGTAYIAWNGPETVSTLHICRLPRGASKCALRGTLRHVPGTAQAGPYGRPNAFVFVSGGLVKVVSARFGNAVPGLRATYVFTSRTRGATFDGGRIVSRVAFDEVVPGPGNTISGTSSTSTTRFQNTTLESATERFADLSADHPVYGSAVGSAIGLLQARPLVVFTDGITGAARFRLYSGTGDLNDAANWSPSRSIGKGFFPAIGYGARGLYLLSGTGAGPVGVRKWLGTGFGRQVKLANANSSTTSLFEDPGGRLHAIYSDNRKIVHAISDNGVSWRSETLVARILRTVVDTRVIARRDHYGVAVWGEDLARGQYIRVATLRARR